MFRPQPKPWRLAGLLLGSAVVASLAGCFKWMEPPSPITPQHRLLCGSMPQACRNHVYVFFLLGVDPIDCADVSGLRDHLQSLGFIKAYLGDWFYRDHFVKEIRKIHEKDPLARFAVVGYCLGAVKARELAGKLQGDEQPIDLLVYLGEGVEGPRPGNVLKLVNIQGTRCLGKSPQVEGAENITYPEVSVKKSVKHPQTLDLLVRELTLVGSRVPVIDKLPPPNPFPAPTPRPLGPVPSGPRDEWDFLKPQPLLPPGQTPTQPTPPVPPQREMLPKPKPVEEKSAQAR